MTTIQNTTTSVTILPGDITVVPADALLTLITSGGDWRGRVDGAIMRKAGQQFHQIAAQRMPTSAGKETSFLLTVHASGIMERFAPSSSSLMTYNSP